MKRRRTRILIVLVLVGGAWWFGVRAIRKQSVRFPDSTMVTLERVKIGRTNEFVHGTAIEKILGDWLPTNGIHFWHLNLNRPGKVHRSKFQNELLTAEFKVTGESVRNSELIKDEYHMPRLFRVLIVGDDGFEHPYGFQPPFYPDAGNAFLGYVSTTVFQRDATILRFRFERRSQTNNTWERIGELVYHHTPDTTDEDWTAETFPLRRSTNGVEVTLGEVAVHSRPLDHPYHIYHHQVTIPLQVTKGDVVLTNWSARSIKLRDSSGNEDFSLAAGEFTNGWMLLQAWRALDPRKIWRMEADMAQVSGYPASNLFTVQIPSLIPSLLSPITTNMGGFPIQISYDGQLSVQMLTTNRPDLRLSFVRVEDPNGKDLAQDDQVRSVKGGKGFAKSITFSRPEGKVVITFAIHQNVPLEFTFKPRLIRDGEGQRPAVHAVNPE